MGAPLLPPESARLGEGRYALVSKIGEGGMSAVYRALDRKLRVWRAIKILQPRAAQIPEIRERFEREAQTMALLEHPHLVRVYDVGQLDDLPFLVMELVDGGTLDQWVETHGRMPPRMAVDAVRQVARALAAVHAFEVVHRDVKPNNVLVTPAGLCKLTDFGIARTEADRDAGGAADAKLRLGTRGYMAPEQRSAPAQVDARADLYGLGATLWRLLRAEQPQDLFLADTQPLLLRGIPPRLHPILIRCLAHRKERRFASAAALVAALDEVIDQLPEDPIGVPPLALPPDPQAGLPGSSSTFDTDSNALSPLSASDPGVGAPVTPAFPPRPAVAARSVTPAAELPLGRTPAPSSSWSTPAEVVRAPTPTPAHRTRTPGAPVRAEPLDRTQSALHPPIRRPSEIEAAPDLDQTPPAPLVRWMALSVIAGVVVVVFVVVTGLAGLLHGRAELARTHADVEDAANELTRILSEQRRMVDDLGLRGTEKEMMDLRFARLDQARGEAERMVAATDLVQAYMMVLGTHHDVGSRSVDAFRMSENLRTLRAARRQYDASVHAWRAAGDTVAGRLVIGLGLAESPP